MAGLIHLVQGYTDNPTSSPRSSPTGGPCFEPVYHEKVLQPWIVGSEYGYFLDGKVNLATLYVTRFSIRTTEVETSNLAQRLLLEATRECIDDAGKVNFQAKPIGCYTGCFEEEYLDMLIKGPRQAETHKLDRFGDSKLSNRILYKMDLHTPWYAIFSLHLSSLRGQSSLLFKQCKHRLFLCHCGSQRSC